VRSKSGINTLRKKKLSNKTAAQRCVWRFYSAALKNSLNRRFPNVIDRMLGASGKHAATNPLGKLALEGTIFMLMCLPLAYAISIYRMEWFFPAVLMIIGGRYLTFGTIYGTRLYWLLGALFGMAAWISVSLALPPHTSALIGAAIEIVFGLVLYMTKRNA
jgi:hypothetical protein